MMVVTTRAESARKKEEERIMREKEAQSMVRPTPVVQGGVREETPTRLTKRTAPAYSTEYEQVSYI